MEGSKLYRNMVSYFGGLIVVISFLLMLLLFLFDFSVRRPSPYVGIFTYMIAPGFMMLGILVFLYGSRRESRRRRRVGAEETLPYPRLDLNDEHQRKLFTLAFAGGSLLVILLSFAGYNAYLFTDSTTFCGRLCHRVMKPNTRPTGTDLMRGSPVSTATSDGGALVREIKDLRGPPGFRHPVPHVLEADPRYRSRICGRHGKPAKNVIGRRSSTAPS